MSAQLMIQELIVQRHAAMTTSQAINELRKAALLAIIYKNSQTRQFRSVRRFVMTLVTLAQPSSMVWPTVDRVEYTSLVIANHNLPLKTSKIAMDITIISISTSKM